MLLIETFFSQTLQRLDKYIYIYQEIVWLYTLFKLRFRSSIVTSSEEVYNQLSRTIQHNLQWKGIENIPSIAKKQRIRKKLKIHHLTSNQKLASTQTHGSAFLLRIQIVHNSKYEHDLLKIFEYYFLIVMNLEIVIVSIFQGKI